MENKNFINQSLWAGSSPNQTGETQSRENRIGVFSYFYRTFVLLFMLLTIGVGQAWADAQFDNVYIYYSLDGGTTETGYECNYSVGDFTNGAVVTSSLKITKVYMKYRKYDGNVCNGQLFWYNGTDHWHGWNKWIWDEGCWSYSNNDKAGSQLKNESFDLTLANSTDASGNYTIYYYWQLNGQKSSKTDCNDNWYIPNNTTKQTLTYTILPPAVNSFSVERSGYLAGNGTEGDPYLVASGSNLTLTASGSQAHTDANSSINYKFGDDDYSTTATKNITVTSSGSIAVKACCKNTSAALDGAETETITIYYVPVSVKDITVYIYVGGCTDDQINSLVLTGTPYVGSTALSGVHINTPAGWTTDGNWRSYTFSNVTKVHNLQVAGMGGAIPLKNIENATEDFYYRMFDGTELDDKCVSAPNLTWTTAPVDAKVGVHMKAVVNTTPVSDGSPRVTWYTSNSNIAAVNESTGEISYKAAGDVTITAHVTWDVSGDYCAGYDDLEQTITVIAPEITAATFVQNPILTTDHLQVSISYRHIPAEGCYIRLKKKDGGYYNDEANQDFTAISEGSGNLIFTTLKTDVPSGVWTVEIWNQAKDKLLHSRDVEGSLTVKTGHTITVTAGANGAVSPSTVYAGDGISSANFTATPNTGYEFIGWTKTEGAENFTLNSPSSAETYVTTASSNGTVRADFRGALHTLTLQNTGHGRIISSPEGTARTGETVTITPTPDSGYEFDYIEVNGVSQGSGVTTFTMPGADVTVTAHFKLHRPELGAVIATPSGTQNYAGSPIDFALSVTSTYLPNPVVVFWVNDGETTYEVVGAPYGANGNDAAGTIGDDAANTTVHKATFTASEARTYTVSAKLYEGELIDNFEGENTRGWAGDNLGNGSMTFANNPVKMTVNGSNKVMQVTRTGGADWGGAIMLFVDKNAKATCDAAGSNDYTYIHARMKDATDATHLKNNDNTSDGNNGDINPSFVGATSSDWRHVTYRNTHCSNNFLFFMIQRGNTDDKTVYIDDIILSNEETMTEKAHEASTASFSIRNTYTIIYKDKDNADFSGIHGDGHPTTHTYGTATNLNTATKEGFTFGGWYTNAECTGEAVNSLGKTAYSDDITLYAKWTENLTSVTLAASPSGRGSFTIDDSPATSTSAGVATKPTVTAVPITGYFLTGTIWSADNSNISLSATNTAYTTITGCGTASTSSTLTATFTEKYLLCGSVNADGDPEGGMRGWATSGNNNAYSSVTYDDNTITIVANLTNAGTQYKCKIIDVQNSAWKGQTGSSSMSSGDQWKWDGTNDVYFTTTVAGSYTFTIDISGSSPSVRITYPGEPEYSATLSVHSSGHGSVSPSAGSITLRPVTTTTITATPEPGYRFKQWTVSGVSCSSTTSATATFTASAAGGTIEAEFTNEGIIYLDKSAISSKWSGTPYVYFYSGEYWNNVSGSGSQTSPSEGVPGTCISASNAMTRIGESQIWYYDYSALLSAGTSKQYIAFVDKSDQTGKNWFDACSVIYRGDFYPGASMFVVRDYTVYKNKHGNVQTAYYNEGYWRKYNDTDPGYVLKIYNGTGGGSTQIGYAKFASEEPGNNTCTAKINLSSGLKGFKVEGCDTTTINGVSYAGTWYSNSGSMTSTNSSNWEFVTSVSNNCGITPTAGGDYIFTLSLADGRLYVSVEYPLANNDYRIVYNGKVKTTGDATHHPSNFIRNTSNGGVGKDTVSFFVTGDWSLTLQKCTNASANPVQWANACDAGHTLTASDLGLSGKTGVYVFEIEQNSSGSCSGVTIRNLGEYTGNYYIRTDVADGGWEAYETVPDNKMIFSEYARDHSGFDYYHCHWTPTNTNVKFTIANDYSACITDTVENDTYVTEYGKLPYQANIRFMYNSAKNTISRAYLNGSSETGVNTFLWLEGAAANGSKPKIFKGNGDALTNDTIKMQDKNNWIYQIDIQANEQARVKLISNYRFNGTDHLQYFKGTDGDWSEATTSEIIGGNYSSHPKERHALRIIYDFKTNHLLSAWLVPESGSVHEAAINTNVMIIKQNQEDARQIIIPSGNDALTEVDTVYTAVLLTKEFLTGGVASEYAKQFYWVSFPYTVKINDIFGSVGTYGYDWILQRYNGKKRAANGFWIDSEPNWEFMDKSETLYPYEGYILTLDLSEFTSGSLKWNNNVTYLSLYFPSDSTVGNIKQKNVTVAYDQTGYACTITRDNRNIKDSYWRCIGSPSFAENTIGGWNRHENTDDTWKTENLPFLYEWNSATNQLSPVAAGGDYTFKPLTGYMVQYSGASLNWTKVVTPSAQAPRRQNSAATDLTYKLQLVRGEEEVDHTFLRFSDDENITAAFEFNQDLCKEYKSGGNIYTITSDAIQVAGNSLPLSTTQTTVVPVGVKIKTAGDYTFSIPEGTDGIGVTLVDNETGVRTLLSALDYTVNLTAGTHDQRFVLEISPIQNTPTGIENVQGDNVQCTKVRKVMIDGILYIVKDGKIFDARGARVE